MDKSSNHQKAGKSEALFSANKNDFNNKKRNSQKIGFAELARNISAKWKRLDQSTRDGLEARASTERARYKREVEEWKRRKDSQKIMAMPTTPDAVGTSICGDSVANGSQERQQDWLGMDRLNLLRMKTNETRRAAIDSMMSSFLSAGTASTSDLWTSMARQPIPTGGSNKTSMAYDAFGIPMPQMITTRGSTNSYSLNNNSLLSHFNKPSFPTFEDDLSPIPMHAVSGLGSDMAGMNQDLMAMLKDDGDDDFLIEDDPLFDNDLFMSGDLNAIDDATAEISTSSNDELKMNLDSFDALIDRCLKSDNDDQLDAEFMHFVRNGRPKGF